MANSYRLCQFYVYNLCSKCVTSFVIHITDKCIHVTYCLNLHVTNYIWLVATDIWLVATDIWLFATDIWHVGIGSVWWQFYMYNLWYKCVFSLAINITSKCIHATCCLNLHVTTDIWLVGMYTNDGSFMSVHIALCNWHVYICSSHTSYWMLYLI